MDDDNVGIVHRACSTLVRAAENPSATPPCPLRLCTPSPALRGMMHRRIQKARAMEGLLEALWNVVDNMAR
ncbi:hypothetical protein CCM_02578 [Cordyceps militaris CM01]|uniref:Uncharacterized protein n=1 Tax=Cordyceps militaris (strain CM01) TaxID=983644 RepID=G3JAJ1_CORMM|nr:uncharacterized protein CCM_02578 [Cordyceps militaris CM01]EGX94307.1 hypothetical protein CCM_02578 [Cordyceps militaris CM01]